MFHTNNQIPICSRYTDAKPKRGHYYKEKILFFRHDVQTLLYLFSNFPTSLYAFHPHQNSHLWTSQSGSPEAESHDDGLAKRDLGYRPLALSLLGLRVPLRAPTGVPYRAKPAL